MGKHRRGHTTKWVQVFEIHAEVTSIKGLAFLGPSRSQMTILTGLGFLVCHTWPRISGEKPPAFNWGIQISIITSSSSHFWSSVSVACVQNTVLLRKLVVVRTRSKMNPYHLKVLVQPAHDYQTWIIRIAKNYVVLKCVGITIRYLILTGHLFKLGWHFDRCTFGCASYRNNFVSKNTCG